jgi:3'-5' exoribonuclease
MSIRDYHIGDAVTAFLLLQSAANRTTASGKPFMTVVLEDATGTIEGKLWDYSGPLSPADIGRVIKVQGIISEFKGAPQMNIERIRLAGDSDVYDVAELVPTAPIDADDAYQEILALVDTLTDPDLQSVCREMLRRHGEEFARIPAAKSVHHGFVHGLLMHTRNMLRTADFLSGLYAEVIDRSLLITGTLLHDFSKLQEFNTSELGLVTDYSMKGNLLGHLVMGAQEAAEVCKELNVPAEKSVLLQHMILAHHGKPEFGAAVLPQCAEAELLSEIDEIDSRMEIYAESLQEVPAGAFSKRIFALEHRIYRPTQQ